MRRTSTILAILALLLLASGCSSSPTSQSVSGSLVFATPVGLQSPHELQASPRTTSATAFLSKQAVDCLAEGEFRTGPLGLSRYFFPNHNPNSGRLEDHAHAVYEFWVPQNPGPALIHSIWASPPAEGNFYMGLANFESDRWDWYQSPVSGLLLADLSPFIGPAGEVFVALVVGGTDDAILREVRINEGGIGEPSWRTYQVTESPLLITQSSLLVLGGSPCVFAAARLNEGADFSFDIVSYQAGDPDCESWQPRRSVFNNPNANVELTSLSSAIIAGKPAVAATRDFGSNGEVWYLRCADAAGSSWPQPPASAIPGVLGEGSELVGLIEVDSRPAMLFNEPLEAEQSARYFIATDAQGSLWNLTDSVNSGYSWARAYDLKVIDGFPAVGLWGRNASTNTLQLRYSRSSDSSGLSWPDLSSFSPIFDGAFVDTPPPAGLLQLAGMRACTCFSYGPDFWSSVSLDDAGLTWDGNYFVLGAAYERAASALITGVPYTACIRSDQTLVMRANEQLDGKTWADYGLIDTGVDLDQLSMAEVNGRPAVLAKVPSGQFDSTSHLRLYMYY